MKIPLRHVLGTLILMATVWIATRHIAFLIVIPPTVWIAIKIKEKSTDFVGAKRRIFLGLSYALLFIVIMGLSSFRYLKNTRDAVTLILISLLFGFAMSFIPLKQQLLAVDQKGVADEKAKE